jgi:hypothetical protein
MTDSDQSAASRSGGININVSGGMVSVTGDLIGQDSQRGTQDRSPTVPAVGAPPSETADRTGMYEAQAVQEGIVIRQELLAELRDSQSALECYVTGYIESYPEVGLVKQVRSLLEDKMYKKSDAATLYPPDFWQDLRNRLENVEPLSTRLKSLLQYDELRPHLEAFDAHLIKAREQVQRVLLNLNDIDLRGSAFELNQTIASMLHAISRITEVCRTNTDSMLNSLRTTINRIFERIKVEEERKRAVALRQPEGWGKTAPEDVYSTRAGIVPPASDESTRSRG